MKSSHIEDALDAAAYRVVWGDYKPKYEFLAEYCPNTMLDPEWDALDMVKYELMALSARKQYGINTLPKQD